MTNITWVNPRGGFWDTAINWSPATVPGIADDVTLPALAVAYVASIAGGASESADTLTMAGVAAGTPRTDGSVPSSVALAIGGGSTLLLWAGLDSAPGAVGEIDLSGASTLNLSYYFSPDPGITLRFTDDSANRVVLDSTGPIDRLSPQSPNAFAGAIAGFTTSDLLVLGVAYASTDSLAYAGGVLTVTTTIPNYEYLPGDPNSPLTLTEPAAILNFDGHYTEASFRIVDDGGTEAIAFVRQRVIGAAGGHATLGGTSGDDTIIAFGAYDLIHGDGGSDVISGGSGGHNAIYEGTPGDGQIGFHDSITIGGASNVVDGGDADFGIFGGSGESTILLGDGDNNITLLGGANNVTVGGGVNTIDAGGGGSQVRINADKIGFQDSVSFTGAFDRLMIQPAATGTARVIGGDSFGVFDLGAAAAVLITDGTRNSVTAAASSTITPGSGEDTVTLVDNAAIGPGDFVIHLDGFGNVVQGIGESIRIDGGSGGEAYHLDGTPTQGGGAVIAVIADGTANRFVLTGVNDNTIVAGSGQDNVLIYDTATGKSSSVAFAGVGNVLQAGDGDLTAIGGDGGGTYTLGAGDDRVSVGGTGNAITLGTGTDNVTAGSGQDSVALNGSDASVHLQGAGDMVFLNPGASGSIDGVAPGLRLIVAAGVGDEVIRGFSADTGAYIHLLGGVGGYSTVAQVVAALTPDGAGGALLRLGTGSLDFVGVAVASLHGNVFEIG